MSSEPDAHDLVAYPANSYPATHPSTLAAIAMLHDLAPAPVDHCRVLEVGCNEGANLIPMAYAIPGSHFTGFDIAGLPIARGRRRIAELGLTNIRLFQADLMDVDGALSGHSALSEQPVLSGEDTPATFDYIIAHGVYTWVPEPVRERLLALCRRHLASNGIAFISYNALPGGHLKNMLRDILTHGMAGIEDPAAAVLHGFQFLRFLTEARPQGDPFRTLLEKELARLEKRGPQAVFHDELSSAHQPVSFAHFMARATAHGLQYLGESTLPPPNDLSYKPAFVHAARSMSHHDPIAQEQVLDFARMRMYRETLLCHAERPLSTDLSIDLLDRLYLSSPVTSSPGKDSVLRIYTLPGGVRMESSHPPTVALLEHLVAARSQALPFLDLATFLSSQGMELDAEFFRLLFQLVVSRMVELHGWAAPVSRTIAHRPTASATARQEAAASNQVTTLLHTTLVLDDPLVKQLLLLLDGTRDRTALLEALHRQNPHLPAVALDEGLENSLQLLNQTGVLLAESPLSLDHKD